MKRAVLLLLASGLAAACNEKKAEAAAPPAAPPAPAEVKPPEPPKVDIALPKDLEFSADAAVVAQGKELFASKGCIGCHKIGGGKLVGPDLKGITARREKEWLAKMILRPEQMVQQDPTAKKLFTEHLVQMPNQGVDPEKELKPLLAYLKSVEQ